MSAGLTQFNYYPKSVAYNRTLHAISSDYRWIFHSPSSCLEKKKSSLQKSVLWHTCWARPMHAIFNLTWIYFIIKSRFIFISLFLLSHFLTAKKIWGYYWFRPQGRYFSAKYWKSLVKIDIFVSIYYNYQVRKKVSC